MARKVRVEFPGAVYHVMNRGDRRGIFTAKIAEIETDRSIGNRNRNFHHKEQSLR